MLSLVNNDDEVGVVQPVNVRNESEKLTAYFPQLLQLLISEMFTWFTGKATVGQVPLIPVRPLYYELSGLLEIFVGVSLSSSVVHALACPYLLLLLIPSWVLTVGGARKLQLSVNHYGVHGNFLANYLDKWVLEINSTLLLIANYSEYKQDHCGNHHHPRLFSSFESDPDAQFLYLLGFTPGKTVSEYWRLFWSTIFSPKFHWLFFKARFQSNFITAPIYRRLMSIFWSLAILGFVILTNSYLEFFLAVFIPLGILYHIASLCQFLSEHRWGTNELLQYKCFGRFCGDRPPFGQPLSQWVWWFLRLPYHLIVRLTVVPADIPNHHIHHFHPQTQSQWSNLAYTKIAQENQYIEFWGLEKAIDYVFEGLANHCQP